MAHKLVLNTFSLYFSGLFKYSLADRIEIRQFDGATMKCILHFAYTGELRLDTSNVFRVIEACDFLQLAELDFIQESVCDFLKKRVNKANCPAMLVKLERFHAPKLKSHLVKFPASNFASVSLLEDFIEIPVELFVKILQSKLLVANINAKVFYHLPQNKKTYLQASDKLLSKLIRHIRCLCLSPSSMQKLKKSSGSASLNLVRQAKEEIKQQDDHLLTLWGTLRDASLPKERSGHKHAHQVYVGSVQNKFGDELFTGKSSLFVKGMKIWIRLWDGRPVIGGLMIFYSNGESPVYGSCDHENSECHEFNMADDERIIKAEIRSGWMIDSLTFFTYKDRVFGPYGGDGGNT
ncbi:kelch-like protein 20 [Dendronephthya gigantea]|uniref:kelch-like protein 20 n=1 Tax=Dendronephthya gigantea TaxID=151771 RepID=UPI00106BE3F7|nr:kelch-like protein 20 [Dendronephthya gigantea]